MNRNIKKHFGGCKKGYFLSLIVISILMVLSAFTLEIVSQRYDEYSILKEQVFSDKLAFTVNDVLMDIRPMLSFVQLSNSSHSVFEENYTYVKSVYLSDEQSNLESFSNLSGTAIGFSYSFPLQINLSNGLTYVSDESDLLQRNIAIYNRTGANLELNSYYIDIVSNQSRGAYIEPTFGASGTYVRINYTDPVPSLSFVSEGYLNGNNLNIWRINLPLIDKNATIKFGLIDGKTNAFSLHQYDINYIDFVRVDINFTDKTDLYGNYSIFLNMSFPNANFIHPLTVR